MSVGGPSEDRDLPGTRGGARSGPVWANESYLRLEGGTRGGCSGRVNRPEEVRLEP